MSARTLVIGVGNGLRRDDAVGLVAVRRLRERLPGSIDVRESGGDAVGLIDLWAGASVAIVVDAVSSGSSGGTLHRFEAAAGPLPVRLFARSTHALSLAEAVELARALGRLPRRLVVYGIEGERFDAGEGLSPRVAEALDDAVGEIAAEADRALVLVPR